MTTDNARLDNLERVIVNLSQQVGRVAESMERLAVMEERNSVMGKAMVDLRGDMKDAAKINQIEIERLTDKYDSLNNRMTSLVAAMTVVSALVSLIAPFLIKYVLGS